MKQAKIIKVNDNPFFGLSKTNNLLSLKTATDVNSVFKVLNDTWSEVKDTKIFRELFFVIMFSIGDIPNRIHNIFKGKVDKGGEGVRDVFNWFIEWLYLSNQEQFVAFANSSIIQEYVGWNIILESQVKTKVKTKQITEVKSLIKTNPALFAKIVAHRIDVGTDMERAMIAKWTKIPRTSARTMLNKDGQRVQRKLQHETYMNNVAYVTFLYELSVLMNWKMSKLGKTTLFTGFKSWRKKYISKLGYYVFSTQDVKGYDREMFMTLLNNSASTQRYQIRTIILTKDNEPKDKWKDFSFAKWYLEWENIKLDAQRIQRQLEAKAETKVLTDVEKEQLVKAKREGKVNVGATSLMDVLEGFVRDPLNTVHHQSILDNTEFKVPVLPIVDISGSMAGLSERIASLAATLILLKNPEQQQILGVFGNNTTFITEGSDVETIQKFQRQYSKVKVTTLVNKQLPLIDNYKAIYTIACAHNESTRVDTIGKRLREWITNGGNVEELSEFPVILILSDGDFNNAYDAKSSLLELQEVCNSIGWYPVICLWDITPNNSHSRLEGIPNFVHYIGYNASVINQVFKNIDELEVVDTFTQLLSLYKSNRYDLVKEQVI